MKLDFFYWGAQCIHIPDMLALFHQKRPGITIRTHDVSENHELAKRQRMYFPFLTVLEGSRRFYTPIREDFFAQIQSGKSIREAPCPPPTGELSPGGEVVPLRRGAMGVASQCGGQCSAESCTMKANFLRPLVGDLYGFIHIKKDTLLDGAEYVPSVHVPYDIPKGPETAFLTCIYHRYAAGGTPSRSLTALETHLRFEYTRVLSICDDEGVYPNGPLKWFLEQGYEDMGIVMVEPGFCRLHLIGKML